MTENPEHRELVAELVEAIARRWPTATVCWDSEWAGWERAASKSEGSSPMLP